MKKNKRTRTPQLLQLLTHIMSPNGIYTKPAQYDKDVTIYGNRIDTMLDDEDEDEDDAGVDTLDELINNNCGMG